MINCLSLILLYSKLEKLSCLPGVKSPFMIWNKKSYRNTSEENDGRTTRRTAAHSLLESQISEVWHFFTEARFTFLLEVHSTTFICRLIFLRAGCVQGYLYKRLMIILVLKVSVKRKRYFFGREEDIRSWSLNKRNPAWDQLVNVRG